MSEQKAIELEREYHQRFLANANYRDNVWRVLCSQYFSRFISAEDSVLDLGAGWGEFSRNINAQKIYAMDLNPETGRRLPDHATFLQQDCSTPWPLNPDSLDVVFTSNFLEHLPDKAAVDQTLAHALEALKPGGRIVCMGPNIKFVPGAYWDFWDHYIPLTELSLAEALSLSGFEITQTTARFMPYSMSDGFNPPLFFVRAYLYLPIVWRLLGKQFLVVARKPS